MSAELDKKIERAIKILKMKYNKQNPLKCFFAFEGYNSQGMGLNRLKQTYPEFGWICVGRSEIDKYAIKACEAVFPNEVGLNYGDISKIDWSQVPDFDLFTYSFPCTDISNAGKQEGLEKGSGTRSSLLWECQRTIETKMPKYLLMENVKALTSKKFLPYLNEWQNYLSGLGYSNFTKVLNAKDFGCPQNRERVFLVSILGDDERFYFPEPFKLEKRLKDVLEKNVDEKYYLSKKMMDAFKINGRVNSSQDGIVSSPEDIAPCHTAGHGNMPKVIEPRYGNKRVQSVVDKGLIDPDKVQFIDAYNQSVLDDVANTIKTTVDTSCMSFVTEPKIVQQFGDRGTKQYSVRDIAHTIPANPMSDRGQMLLEPKVMKMGNYSPSGHNASSIVDTNGISPTVMENHGTVTAVVEPINADKEGLCRTIKAQYYKNSGKNLVEKGSYGCTGVVEFKGLFNNTRLNTLVKSGKISPIITSQGEPLNVFEGVSVNPVGRKLEFKGLDSIKFDASPCLRATDYKSPHCVWEGVEFKGKQIKDGDGLYLSASEGFFRGGLGGVSRTLKANVNDAGVCIDYRIRKLTPRECFRLMGVSDTDIDKIQVAGISNSQQYKMAGNSIVVDVLYHLFRKMFIEKENESQQLTLF